MRIRVLLELKIEQCIVVHVHVRLAAVSNRPLFLDAAASH